MLAFTMETDQFFKRAVRPHQSGQTTGTAAVALDYDDLPVAGVRATTPLGSCVSAAAVTFTFTLSAPATADTTINFSLPSGGGDAVEGTDYPTLPSQAGKGDITDIDGGNAG
jgi:hypothetical protein